MAKLINLDTKREEQPQELPPGWAQHPVEHTQFVKVQGALAFQVTRNPPMPPNIPAGARPKAALTAMNIAENKAATTYHGSDTEAFAYADLVFSAAQYSQLVTSGIDKENSDKIIACIHRGRQSGMISDDECSEFEKLINALRSNQQSEPEVASGANPLDGDSNLE